MESNPPAATPGEAPAGDEPTRPALSAAAPAPPAGRWSSPVVHLTIILPLALVMFLFQLGAADWQDDSESCGGQIMQEMVDGNGWVLPLRNARHIPVKPPLFYWLGALSAEVRHSGVDLLDSRLPSAVMGALCVALVYAFARRIAGGRVALWSALILMTTPQYIIEARNSRVDMTFCVFVTAGLFLAHRVWEGEAGRRTAVLAGLAFGLAVLSKGPLAIALAVLVLAATAVVAAPSPGWRALIKPAALAGSIGLPALWYAAATIEHGRAFLQIHFYAENVGRLLGEQGRFPVWWYIEPLLTGGLPWTLALPLTVRGQSAVPARSRRFFWAWWLAMFVFFSLSPGKRRAYLIMIRPVLAIILAGWLVPQLARLRELRRSATVPRAAHIVMGGVVLAGVLSILALRSGLAGFGASEASWSHWWQQYLRDYTGVALALVIGTGIGIELMARWTWQRRFDLAAYALVGTLALGLTVGISAGAIVRGEGASFRQLAQRIATQVGAGEPLAFFDLDDETAIALLFHLRRHVAVVQPASATRPCEPPGAGLYLVSESAWDARACFRDPRWQAIERGGPLAQSQRWRRLVLARYAAAPA